MSVVIRQRECRYVALPADAPLVAAFDAPLAQGTEHLKLLRAVIGRREHPERFKIVQVDTTRTVALVEDAP